MPRILLGFWLLVMAPGLLHAQSTPMAEESGVTAPGPSVAEGMAKALAHDLSPWGMYLAADWVVKTVMITLFAASVLTWTVWLFKVLQLAVARRRVARILQALVQAPSFQKARRDAGTGHEWLLLRAGEHELQLSALGPASDDGIKERVSSRLERVLASLASQMNRGTGILATIGSVAPFVGLFGTVWGIMNSFIGIAETQTTNLAVVAPGIAEALLATALGLVAAIPAVVMYNHFARSIGYYRLLLADVSAALMTLISRDLDRDHPQARYAAALSLAKNDESDCRSPGAA